MNNYAAIPDELKSLNQWVCWNGVFNEKKGKMDKIPVNAKTGRNASHSNPETWASHQDAVDFHEGGKPVRVSVGKDENNRIVEGVSSGIGFVFSEDDPYVGVDLDHCAKEGVEQIKSLDDIEPWALSIIETANTYSEVSPSGQGIKLWLKGKMPGNKGRRNDNYETGGVEMYPHHRFFTVTGNHLDGIPTTITHNTDAIVEICDKVFQEEPKRERRKPSGAVSDDDQELLDKAQKAKNGDKFARLWKGDKSDFGGDHSRADLALCSHLAFWTGCDPARIDSLFRQSGLYREKWERADYRQWTIDKALEQANCYEKNYRSEKESDKEDGTKSEEAEVTEDGNSTSESPLPTIVFPESAWRLPFSIYRKIQKGTTEACDPYHFAVFKTVAGAIVGRTCYVYNGRKLYPNFYTVLIGPTRRARKSTAKERGEKLLEASDPLVIIQHGLATPEGLIAKLVPPELDALGLSDLDLKRAESVTEHEGLRLVATINEFASVLRKAQRENNGLIQCLTDAYDAPSALDNPTRHNPLSAKKPFVSVLALSTQEWLESSLRVEDIHGGFVNRHTFYLYEPTAPIANPTEPNPDLMSELVDWFREFRKRRGGQHVRYKFDVEASLLLEQWYEENYNREFGSIIVEEAVQRVDENVRKLALLYAILENNLDDYEIHVDQLQAAIQVGGYWEKSAMEIFSTFSTSKQSRDENLLLRHLSVQSLTRRQLQQKVGGNMSARAFNETLKALLDAGMVRWEPGKVKKLSLVE